VTSLRSIFGLTVAIGERFAQHRRLARNGQLL
jgi:hypothetical protein